MILRKTIACGAWTMGFRLWIRFAIFSAVVGSVIASSYKYSNEPSQQPVLAGKQQSFKSLGYHGQQSLNTLARHSAPNETFPALLDALEVKQSHFFALWQGTWLDAIDWTAAVMGTMISGALISLTKSYDYNIPSPAYGEAWSLSNEEQAHENLINKYFTHITSFYFGEHAFSLRTQAYDDMLWVVLGWLENIKFISLHSSRHYQTQGTRPGDENYTMWYGTQFIPVFSHRARLFYDLASKGWDISLCGGGMIWNPYLKPYKNAITNELFIAASIGMYLHFPGDDNSSPFVLNNDHHGGSPLAKPHDVKYLVAAVQAYDWLALSNMTNEKGLFVDGYHIRGWNGANGSLGSGECDERNEMVYTYNQGVLLSGLRGLWEATGLDHYLSDGYSLIHNVVAATGWNIEDQTRRKRWAGLGRNGILEETCDASGTCSQDGQTFKGIFFHHMTLFCAPLPRVPHTEGKTFAADDELIASHDERCGMFAAWVQHNALAAMRTRDQHGEFGMWWGQTYDSEEDEEQQVPKGGVDYRNLGVPQDRTWQNGATMPKYNFKKDDSKQRRGQAATTRDVNDRGRGRTVETQAGGLAVLRAMWELVDRPALT